MSHEQSKPTPRSEHPEDRRMRIEAQKYGRRYAKEFCRARPALIARLIGEYADASAQELLDGLREKFWAQDWKPATRPARGKR